MPELPEVETVKRGLETLKNRKVKSSFKSDKNLRFASHLNFDEIINAQILNIKRRARYLVVEFDNDLSLIIHLGMTGKVTLGDEFLQLKHDHFALEFFDGSHLVFNDARRFGFIDLIKSQDLDLHKSFKDLGPEPLADEFDFKYLKSKLAKKQMNIKTAMMDNKIVVGVGNIYINESLFESGILPQRLSSSLKDSEIKKLIKAIKRIIAQAIEKGGSSISDYVNASGELGYFQNSHKVYGRDKENCLICNNLIEKMVQNGRSSFFCSKCQK